MTGVTEGDEIREVVHFPPFSVVEFRSRGDVVDRGLSAYLGFCFPADAALPVIAFEAFHPLLRPVQTVFFCGEG